jgi:hypothetical protein
MRPTTAALCLLAAASCAAAQDAPTPPPPPTPPPEAAARPRFLYTVGQSIDAASVPHLDGGGKATTALSRTDFSLAWLAGERTRAVLDVSNEFAFYDFDGAFKLDPVEGAPFGSFTRQNIDVLVTHRITPRWVLLGVGGVGVARERNADVGDAYVWRAGIGATYYLTRDIALGASLLANSQLEGDFEILPLPQIDATFSFDEQWSLKVATIGGATLAYQASDELAFTLKAGYQERQYRLDDEGFAPRGVFQDKSIDLMLGVLWQPDLGGAGGLDITAGVGSQLWRRFKIKDEDGNRLSRVETDPTLVLHAGLSYSF